MQDMLPAKWSERSYQQFSQEGYIRNVVAHRAIHMIASCASSVPWKLYRCQENQKIHIKAHPLLTLLAHPNPYLSGSEYLEQVYSYRLISGNSFQYMAVSKQKMPIELYALRPDRVEILIQTGGLPAGYRYRCGQNVQDMMIDLKTGLSTCLHWRYFHPLNDWYGLSPIESAAYSIDQHNQSSEWNQSLLQNGARPSGALVVKPMDDGSGGYLTDDQFYRLKNQFEQEYSGSAKAGKPLILEGGLEWHEMGYNPKDMDFLESKHSSAREIALAFGVPPQLLGIPGDNTYSNLAEARLALWEQTILPMIDQLTGHLNRWLVRYFEKDLLLGYDSDSISALAPRRDSIWSRLEKADFLTQNEKREMVGLGIKSGN
ncbi:MAG: phage portal protein [Alphaproteobacteria bacterium]|nr:phage portal protein [Alphaproteobacteria bacterium]